MTCMVRSKATLNVLANRYHTALPSGIRNATSCFRGHWLTRTCVKDTEACASATEAGRLGCYMLATSQRDVRRSKVEGGGMACEDRRKDDQAALSRHVRSVSPPSVTAAGSVLSISISWLRSTSCSTAVARVGSPCCSARPGPPQIQEVVPARPSAVDLGRSLLQSRRLGGHSGLGTAAYL